jgi:hypothetical protein
MTSWLAPSPKVLNTLRHHGGRGAYVAHGREVVIRTAPCDERQGVRVWIRTASPARYVTIMMTRPPYRCAVGLMIKTDEASEQGSDIRLPPTRLPCCELPHQDVCRPRHACAESTHPIHEMAEQLPDQALFVRELAVCIKPLCRVANHHFGPLQRMRVEQDTDLPPVVLGASRIERPDGRTHDGDGLAFRDTVTRGAQTWPGAPLHRWGVKPAHDRRTHRPRGAQVLSVRGGPMDLYSIFSHTSTLPSGAGTGGAKMPDCAVAVMVFPSKTTVGGSNGSLNWMRPPSTVTAAVRVPPMRS